MIKTEIRTSMLREALSSVTALVDETKIEFRNGGLRIKTVDDANVGAVSLSLLEDAFEYYEGGDENVCVDISRLESITKKLNSDLVKLSVNEDRDTLSTQSGRYKFELPLLDPSAIRDAKDPRDIEPPSEVIFKGEKLTRLVNMAGMFSDNVVLGTDSETFYAISEGDHEKMDVDFKVDELVDGDFVDARSTYNVNYLKNICKNIPDSEDVYLEIGHEYPAKITFGIANGNGRVTYSLAPMIS